MQIHPCVRPMLFENDDVQFRLSIRGTSFLIRYTNRLFAVTAKHNVKDFHPKQYRIAATLGSHSMLPYLQPFTVELHVEDFEDFVVIPIDEGATSIGDFTAADATELLDSGIDWTKIERVFVYGFPSEDNLPDYENGRIEFQPSRLYGVLTGRSCGEGLREIEIADVGDLKSLDGFSGSPVFAAGGSCSRLLGIVIRGSQDTSISKLLHFLDSRVMAALIKIDLEGQASSSS